MRQINKPFFFTIVAAIIVIAVLSIAPVIYKIVSDPGVKTLPLTLSDTKPASTDLNGNWEVVKGGGANSTQVGFTFNEVLPGKRKTTSGSTHAVEGSATIANNTLMSGSVTVDATTLKTDVKKRDINMKMKLLHTDKFPTATFSVDKPVPLGELPSDGQPATVLIPGTLTLHGVSKQVNAEFQIVRTGKRILMFSEIPVNRLDYDVITPDFIAATIAEEGTLDVRLDFEKKN